MRLLATKHNGIVITDSDPHNLFPDYIRAAGELIDLTINVTYVYSTEALLYIPSILQGIQDGVLQIYDGNYVPNNAIPAGNAKEYRGLSISTEALFQSGITSLNLGAANLALSTRNRYQTFAATYIYSSPNMVLNMEYFVDQFPYKWQSQMDYTMQIIGYSSGDLTSAYVSARIRYYTEY